MRSGNQPVLGRNATVVMSSAGALDPSAGSFQSGNTRTAGSHPSHSLTCPPRPPLRHPARSRAGVGAGAGAGLDGARGEGAEVERHPHIDLLVLRPAPP